MVAKSNNFCMVSREKENTDMGQAAEKRLSRPPQMQPWQTRERDLGAPPELLSICRSSMGGGKEPLWKN